MFLKRNIIETSITGTNSHEYSCVGIAFIVQKCNSHKTIVLHLLQLQTYGKQ